MELFDSHGVAFVSVTQSFNTTTNMGRQTLNVLLSFAQFEREVTGERIRDKIAVSTKKGLWVGGVVPLGYEVNDRKLIVNDEEAATVRLIFSRYLDLGSLSALQPHFGETNPVAARLIRKSNRLTCQGIVISGDPSISASTSFFCIGASRSPFEIPARSTRFWRSRHQERTGIRFEREHECARPRVLRRRGRPCPVDRSDPGLASAQTLSISACQPFVPTGRAT